MTGREAVVFHKPIPSALRHSREGGNLIPEKALYFMRQHRNASKTHVTEVVRTGIPVPAQSMRG